MAHRDRARPAVPVDLLDTVTQFEDLLIRRPTRTDEIESPPPPARPSRMISTPRAAKILARLGPLGNTLNLPGDLVDIVLRPEMLGIGAGVLALVELFLVEQSERVMITGISAEKTGAAVR